MGSQRAVGIAAEQPSTDLDPGKERHPDRDTGHLLFGQFQPQRHGFEALVLASLHVEADDFVVGEAQIVP